ncbi:dTMP kinase [Streptacidiphilus sp. PB12-B1b]|uniref:dTMP kinase n=1 Tax=Streptacidiphilus sp. PB12-B1b TaxID=2705012 RepID=UPI0015FA1860|nr:dTMP kinase [Streptacidiphilus sp. PB12-B1b]QMU74687.1 dTMP kinase [Streptacidiphilus sp. PB12-B1b]
MTSAERPGPDHPQPAARADAERAQAFLRVPAYRRIWRTQLLGGVGDRLGLLVLLVLVWTAAGSSGAFGGGERGLLLAIAALFAVRLAGTALFGVALLRPVARLAHRLDRRWTLLGLDALRAALLAVAPFWLGWTGSASLIWLLVSVLVLAAAERVGTVVRESLGVQLLPGAELGRPVADQRPALRHIDRWTGYATVPSAAAALVVLMLVENGLATGVGWLNVHLGALPAFGAAGLFLAAAVLLYRQQLPAAPAVAAGPRSPLADLRAPADTALGLGPRGRTGTSVVFSFAATGAVAAMAAFAAVALPHAYSLGAGPVGFGLLVLAAVAGPLLGLRVAPSVLPLLGRRRLLPLALGTAAVALILSGLVVDFVLALVLATVAGTAAGVAARTARTLLDQETEEARQPKVAEHLYAMLRVAVGAALVLTPLLGAGIGRQQYQDGSVSFDHGGAGLAVAVVGLLLLVLAVVVFLRSDDRRRVAPFSRDVWDALRGGGRPVPHRAGTGFFIALEGGDGAGKSTQAQALAEWIRSKGHEVVVTREPGGSAVGQRLRAMLLDVGNTGISDRAEALLYAADRAEHVESVIRPALERGAVVITDRYIDSSVAYQGAGRDLSGAEVGRISRWATDGLVPDLTVLLDVAPEAARERFTEALDRLESEPVEFHARVRAGFLALAAADPFRYLVVDAGQPVAEVTAAIRHRLDRELPLSEQEKAARAEQERLAREAEAARLAAEAKAKAEAEQAEREKQALLERLRLEAEEQAKARQAEEDRRAAEAARQAAEEARLAAEAEADRRAAQERERREAEAAERRHRAEEQARLAELERQREARRLEERRRAEEALLRAEQARLAEAAAAEAAAQAAAASSADATDDATDEPSADAAHDATDDRSGGASDDSPDADLAETTVMPAVAPDAPTVETPVVRPGGALPPDAPTQVIPAVAPAEPSRRPVPPRPDHAPKTPPGASGPSSGSAPGASSGAASTQASGAASAQVSPNERTAVLPQLPKSWRIARPRSEESVQDKVPDWLFRPQEPQEETVETAAPPVDRTRELPKVTQEGAAPQAAGDPDATTLLPRARYDWAEETPLDNLPSLTDELLGSRDEWAQWHDNGEEGPEPEGRGRSRR